VVRELDIEINQSAEELGINLEAEIERELGDRWEGDGSYTNGSVPTLVARPVATPTDDYAKSGDPKDDPAADSIAELLERIFLVETEKLKADDLYMLWAIASPYYDVANYVRRAQKVFRTSFLTARRHLDTIFDQLKVPNGFGAVAVGLEEGVIPIDAFVPNSGIFEDAVRSLSPGQKRTLATLYQRAIRHDSIHIEDAAVATEANVGKTHVIRHLYNAKRQLGASNNAQLALYAHIYVHRVRSPIEEVLYREQIQVLEAMVSSNAKKSKLFGDVDKILQIKDGKAHARFYQACQRMGIYNLSVIAAVSKAIELGCTSLLGHVDVNAFDSLANIERAYLKSVYDRRTNGISKNDVMADTVDAIKTKLNIRTEPQLALYVHAAANPAVLDTLRN